jgi:sec-independent protein translocase protein TatC
VGWRRQDDNPEKALPLLGHLEELRMRLIIAISAVLIGTVVGWFLAPPVLNLLTIPIEQSGLVRRNGGSIRIEIDEEGVLRIANPEALLALQANHKGERRIGTLEFHMAGEEEFLAVQESAQPSGVIYLKPTDPVMIRVKASLVLGIILAIPVILYQIYGFIAPGLYPSERNAVRPIMVGSVLLFPVGAGFAYFMLKYALIFLASFASNDVYNDMKAYLSLVLTLMLAFGILFQLPIVVLVLTRLGIVSPQWLAERRKIIFAVLLVVSAFATPPDPFTMLILAVPLYLLFELSILLSRLQGTSSPRSAQDAEANEA